jgi:hypothetical protein
VSDTPSFAYVFRQARAKSAAAGELLAASDTSILAKYGTGKSAIIFTNDNIEFLNKNDTPVKFGWMQLDFILPGDLSLASDKLYTFTDMDIPATRIANQVGVVFAWAAAAYFAYLVASFLYNDIFMPLVALHQNWGLLGDILIVILVVGFFMIVGWWLLAIIVGIFASGGAFSSFAHWLGKQLRPLIRFVLGQMYSAAENGLHVIDQDWVSMPWEPQAKRALDLIFIGVKLRRRGLT